MVKTFKNINFKKPIGTYFFSQVKEVLRKNEALDRKVGKLDFGQFLFLYLLGRNVDYSVYKRYFYYSQLATLRVFIEKGNAISGRVTWLWYFLNGHEASMQVDARFVALLVTAKTETFLPKHWVTF
jgi:hypothetical protein